MGKKYKYSVEEMCNMINDEYFSDENNLNSIKNLINNLPLLIENNLGCCISNHEYYSSPLNIMYRTASKFIQKYNKDLKSNSRKLKNYEFGNDDTILANHDDKAIELAKSVLDDGKYFAMLDKNNYCILVINSPDDYYVDSKIYFIGPKWKKWRNKYNIYVDNYTKLMKKSTKHETIGFTNNKPDIDTMFKPFDQLIFDGKEDIIKYIDNWIDCIPTYYNKYNTISKLSIMIYGHPGTGKSTFYKALAKYLGIENVMVVTPDYFSQTFEKDGRYTNYNMRYKNQTIYAIDDIDCICKARDDKDNDIENSTILSNLLAFLDNPPTFNFKTKDGIQYPVSIIVATTNYYNKLDPAIKRYGRFDLTLEMEDFDRYLAQEMCDIYDINLKDIVKNSNNDNFTISPSKLQALCLRNLDKSLKKSMNEKDYCDGRILVHRIKK